MKVPMMYRSLYVYKLYRSQFIVYIWVNLNPNMNEKNKYINKNNIRTIRICIVVTFKFIILNENIFFITEMIIKV